MGGGGGGGSREVGASEAISLVLRITTVGLSLASAIMMAASTQCLYRDDGVPAGTVSYGDYASKYSAVADLLSAVLQGVAIYLEVVGKERWASTVELIDKLVQALTASSAALLLAVDDITSCGGGPRGQRQRGGGLCGQAGAFCGRVRVSSVLSVAPAVSVSGSVYIKHAPAAVVMPPRPALPPPAAMTILNVVKRKNGGRRKEKDEGTVEKCEVVLIETGKTGDQVKTKQDDKEPEEEIEKEDEECCTQVSAPPPAMPPPWCRCPRLTIPCDCEDPGLCGAFFWF